MTEWLRVNVFTSIRQCCSGVIPTESQRQSSDSVWQRFDPQSFTPEHFSNQEIPSRSPANDSATTSCTWKGDRNPKVKYHGWFHGDIMTTARLIPSRGSTFWAAPASSPRPHTEFDSWPGFWSHYVGWLFWLFLVLLWRYRKEPAEVCLASPCRSSGGPWCERVLMLDHLL